MKSIAEYSTTVALPILLFVGTALILIWLCRSVADSSTTKTVSKPSGINFRK